MKATICALLLLSLAASPRVAMAVGNINIEKATQGYDADAPPGPFIAAGQTVHWTYVVTNTGGGALSNVTVTDDQGVVVSCPSTTLAVGAMMTCTASGVAVPGQYANIGTAEGTTPGGTLKSDQDPSHYFGVPANRPGCSAR